MYSLGYEIIWLIFYWISLLSKNCYILKWSDGSFIGWLALRNIWLFDYVYNYGWICINWCKTILLRNYVLYFDFKFKAIIAGITCFFVQTDDSESSSSSSSSDTDYERSISSKSNRNSEWDDHQLEKQPLLDSNTHIESQTHYLNNNGVIKNKAKELIFSVASIWGNLLFIFNQMFLIVFQLYFNCLINTFVNYFNCYSYKI